MGNDCVLREAGGDYEDSCNTECFSGSKSPYSWKTVNTEEDLCTNYPFTCHATNYIDAETVAWYNQCVDSAGVDTDSENCTNLGLVEPEITGGPTECQAVPPCRPARTRMNTANGFNSDLRCEKSYRASCTECHTYSDGDRYPNDDENTSERVDCVWMTEEKSGWEKSPGSGLPNSAHRARCVTRGNIDAQSEGHAIYQAELVDYWQCDSATDPVANQKCADAGGECKCVGVASIVTTTGQYFFEQFGKFTCEAASIQDKSWYRDTNGNYYKRDASEVEGDITSCTCRDIPDDYCMGVEDLWEDDEKTIRISNFKTRCKNAHDICEIDDSTGVDMCVSKAHTYCNFFTDLGENGCIVNGCLWYQDQCLDISK